MELPAEAAEAGSALGSAMSAPTLSAIAPTTNARERLIRSMCILPVCSTDPRSGCAREPSVPVWADPCPAEVAILADHRDPYKRSSGGPVELPDRGAPGQES